tara:strand:+ start:4483 stop:5169 length:687 start_codon:yes stop_codon:yes gene_type:complete
MKISKQTFDVLKNFSTINSGIVVDPGNKLRTISAQKNIMALANVPEVFESRFAIYDLVQFINLTNSPVFMGGDFTFGDNSLQITNGKAKSTYRYTDENTIIQPTKEVNMPDSEIGFTLKEDDLQTIVSMSGILSKPDLSISSSGDVIRLSVLDQKDPLSNTFDLDVGEGNGDVYNMYYKVENLKILKGDYDVKISSQAISHFKHNDLELEYWIALEPASEYGDDEDNA